MGRVGREGRVGRSHPELEGRVLLALLPCAGFCQRNCRNVASRFRRACALVSNRCFVGTVALTSTGSSTSSILTCPGPGTPRDSWLVLGHSSCEAPGHSSETQVPFGAPGRALCAPHPPWQGALPRRAASLSCRKKRLWFGELANVAKCVGNHAVL